MVKFYIKVLYYQKITGSALAPFNLVEKSNYIFVSKVFLMVEVQLLSVTHFYNPYHSHMDYLGKYVLYCHKAHHPHRKTWLPIQFCQLLQDIQSCSEIATSLLYSPPLNPLLLNIFITPEYWTYYLSNQNV